MKKTFNQILALVLVLLFSFSKLNTAAQNTIIPNDSVNFAIAFTSFSLLDSVYAPIKWLILTETACDKFALNNYAKMDTTTIFSLLDNPDYDWATNLLLFDLYDVNALFFSAFNIKTRADWLEYFKEQDINLWRAFFTGDAHTQAYIKLYGYVPEQ